MSEAPLFELRHVRQEYAGAVAVNVEHLQIRTGEVLCLLGPTGAGKSTLLRLLSGVERPTCGELLFQGRPHHADGAPLATRRRITLVFQRPLLLADTVLANVQYPLRWRGEASRSARATAQRMLDRLGLGQLANQMAPSLSGGQIQLVALARALVLQPEVLLLDEPTANLDPAHVALVEGVIREDFQQRRLTVVWATHNLFQARRVADTVALLLSGAVVEVAATERFFTAPADRRAQDFVEGRMIF